MIDSIIFDLDGTLWNPKKETLEAVNKVTKKYNIDKVSSKTIKEGMGHTDEEVMEMYMPKLEKEDQRKLFKEMDQTNIKNLRKNGSKLYPNLMETLKELKQNYKLFIISNCGAGYIESFLDHYNLNNIFTEFIAASKENISKTEGMKRLIKKYNLKKPIYVGDTFGDFNYAKDANVLFVHAKYGYAPDLESKYKIDRIDNLPDYINYLNKDIENNK